LLRQKSQSESFSHSLPKISQKKKAALSAAFFFFVYAIAFAFSTIAEKASGSSIAI
jgi:hypothetical protein